MLQQQVRADGVKMPTFSGAGHKAAGLQGLKPVLVMTLYQFIALDEMEQARLSGMLYSLQTGRTKNTGYYFTR